MGTVHVSLQRPPDCELLSTQPAFRLRRLVWIVITPLLMLLYTCFVKESLLFTVLANKSRTRMHWLMSFELALREELLITHHTLVLFCIRIMLPVVIIESTLVCKIFFTDGTIKRGLLEVLHLNVISQMCGV